MLHNNGPCKCDKHISLKYCNFYCRNKFLVPFQPSLMFGGKEKFVKKDNLKILKPDVFQN